MATNVLDKIRTAESLPTLPATAIEVLRLTEDEETSVDALASVIERDPALTAKLLRTVNSPLFGITREIRSVKQAVGLVGQRAIRVMALSLSLTEQIDENKCAGFNYEAFWRTSLTTAVAARLIGGAANPEIAEESFVAGLLSQIGRLAAHRVVPEEYKAVLDHRDQHGGRLRDAEKAVLGESGAQLGQAMLERWGLPGTICQAVGAAQGEGLMELEGESRDIALMVHGATIVSDLFCDEISPSTMEQVKQIVMRCTGIDAEALEQAFSKLDAMVRETARNLSLQIGDTTDYAQVRANAALELAQLTMLAETERAASETRMVAAEQEARQLNEEKKQILEVASTDSLTKIANRAAFERRFEEELEAARAKSLLVGLLILDVDHFKMFNDTHGHQAGDEVLRVVAASIRDACGGGAFPARYGGEEFIAVLTAKSASQVAALAEKVRAAIESARVEWNGQHLSVTASVGLATASPAEAPVVGEKLIAEADERLYEAKHAGRNRVMPAAA